MQREVSKQQIRQELTKDIEEASQNIPALSNYVLESIVETIAIGRAVISQDEKARSAKTDLLYKLQIKTIGLDPVQEEESEDDYQNKVDDRKESKDEFKMLKRNIDKFKILGYNSKGWPIYRVTDIYYASDPYIQKIYEDKITMLTKNQRPRKIKEFREETYNQIIQKWKNRENNEFNEQDKDQMDIEELEEIVADMGEKRQNFFLYYKDFNQATEQYFQPLDITNSPLNSCDFLENFNKGVLRRKQQYANIVEYEEDQKAEVYDFDHKENGKSTYKYWGQKESLNNSLLPVKSNLFTLQDELVNPNISIIPLTLTNAILKQHSYINSELIRQKYKLPLQQLQKIEIDLSNPNFFLKKVNLGIAKRGEELYARALDYTKTKLTITNEEVRNRAEQSVISQNSRHTGNPTMSLKPKSDSVIVMEPTGLESFDNLILEKAKLQSQKKPVIKHSDVANRLMFTKFKMEPRDFTNYHRYLYPWRKHDKIELNVIITKTKSTKSKGQFLELNTQKQESNVKFSTFSSLSLSSGDFIAVQNIQQSPLIMSNIGMCTKMYLQVNPKSVVNRMQTEIYKERQFEQLEEARERMALNKQTLTDNCASWRKIIGESLGPHGKLYIGSDSSSLVIGSPQGIGVTVMESNLVSLPVVKQKNNPRDFILVRESGNWYLRRIDNIYTSGQIQPKMEVFPPDSRNINNFVINYFKSYAKKRFQQSSNVNIQEFKQIFSILNEHNLRRNLKEIGARTKDTKHFMGSEDKEVDFDVTPEQICQYQKMQHNLYNLQGLGITSLKTPDKLKQTITTFFKKFPNDLPKFALSKFISDELHLTGWYLSQSFLNAQQGQSKIELVGIGDPTNGHGGYSYVKKPQKQRVQKEQQIDKRVDKKVSGTQFDLRKLKTEDIQKLLIQRGKKPEDFAGMGRWPKINMLKKIGGDQYQRPQRHDKKKKKQTEKRQISAIFNILLKNLHPDIEIEGVNVNQPQTLTLDDYIKREKVNWEIRRDKLFNHPKEQDQSINENPDDGDENDEE